MWNFILVKFNLSKKDKKDLNILINIISTFIIKGGALIVSVLSMPIYIKFFNDSKILGLWFTVLSVMTWILSCDLGIGNGLRNNLVEAIVNRNMKVARQYIFSAYVISAIIAILVGGIGYWGIGLLNWNKLLNISEQILSVDTLLFSIRAIFIGIVLQFILKLITSVLYALQKPAMINFIAFISSAVQVIIVLLLPINSSEENLKVLSLIYGCCTNVPLLIATFIVFGTKLKIGRPKLSDFKFNFATSILKLGGTFFLVQILFIIITNTNEALITYFYGSEYVVDYQIYNKIFTIVGSLFMIALTPLWSAITMAYSEKDILWLKRIYKKLNNIVFMAVIAELGIVVIIKPLINLWVGQSVVNICYFTAFFFAMYGSIFIYQSVLSTIACGLGKLKVQSVCYTLAVILKLIFVYVTKSKQLPWESFVLINIVILIPYCIMQPIALKKIIN